MRVERETTKEKLFIMLYLVSMLEKGMNEKLSCSHTHTNNIIVMLEKILKRRRGRPKRSTSTTQLFVVKCEKEPKDPSAKRTRKRRKRDEEESGDEGFKWEGEIRKGKSNVYDVNFKLAVLKYAETHSNSRTAKKFGVNTKRVREWKKMRDRIEAESTGELQRRQRGDNYTIEEKLQAVAFAEERSVDEAKVLYNVDRRTIEKWKQKKAYLESIIRDGNGCRKRGVGSGRKPRYTQIEDSLRDWVIALRLRNITVNYKMILNKARKLMQENPETKDQPAPSTICWCVGFLTRQNLLGQLGTTLGHEDPQELLKGKEGTDPIQIAQEPIEIPENPNKRHRRTISLQDKIAIIDRIEKGASQSDVARSLKVAQSTIQTIWSCRSQILDKAMNPKNNNNKNIHWKKYSDIDKALYDWYEQCGSKSVHVDGKSLLSKALELCETYKMPDFKTQANKWAETFCKKHNIREVTIPQSETPNPPVNNVQSMHLFQANQRPQTQESMPSTTAHSPSNSASNDAMCDFTSEFYFNHFQPQPQANTVNQNLATNNRTNSHPQQLYAQAPSSLSMPLSNSSQYQSPSATQSPITPSEDSSPVSTLDAMKYLGLIRRWVTGTHGPNEEVLNIHLNTIENAILKKRMAEMAGNR